MLWLTGFIKLSVSSCKCLSFKYHSINNAWNAFNNNILYEKIRFNIAKNLIIHNICDEWTKLIILWVNVCFTPLHLLIVNIYEYELQLEKHIIYLLLFINIFKFTVRFGDKTKWMIIYDQFHKSITGFAYGMKRKRNHWHLHVFLYLNGIF